MSTIVLERRGSEAEETHLDVGEDIYSIEVRSVADFVRSGERSPSAMSWEESLANMRTLDRWRASIGLSYEADLQRVDGRHVAASTAEGMN